MSNVANIYEKSVVASAYADHQATFDRNTDNLNWLRNILQPAACANYETMKKN